MMLSDVCLSVAYIGPKSRTERPRKTKIGAEVAHVTRDSDTTFRGSKVKVTDGVGILWRSPTYSFFTLSWELKGIIDRFFVLPLDAQRQHNVTVK